MAQPTHINLHEILWTWYDRQIIITSHLRNSTDARFSAHSARIGSFRLSAVASGPDQRFKAFSHWKPCFCLALRPSKILIFLHSAQSSEWCLGGKPSPRRQRVRLSPSLYLRYSLGRCPLISANFFRSQHPTATAAGPQKNSPRFIAPPCICKRCIPTVQ